MAQNLINSGTGFLSDHLPFEVINLSIFAFIIEEIWPQETFRHVVDHWGYVLIAEIMKVGSIKYSNALIINHH